MSRVCECSFIGPVTPGPDATDSLHEGVSRVGGGGGGGDDNDDDAAPCVFSSRARSRARGEVQSVGDRM